MLSLQDWCCSNKRLLNEIDVRRIVAYIFFREEKTIIKGTTIDTLYKSKFDIVSGTQPLLL